MKKTSRSGTRSIANVAAISTFLFMCIAFLLETYFSGILYDELYIWFVFGIAFLFLTIAIRWVGSAFTVPLVLTVFYTHLMTIIDWQIEHYLFIIIAICVVSCIYSSFRGSLLYIIFANLLIGYFVIRGTPIIGRDVHGESLSTLVILIKWAVCIFSCVIMLILTRSATTLLEKALEYQHSFLGLLDITKNYVAMIDERNNIVYTSKTLSVLGNTKDPANAQGRPIVDLFPGRSLKLYAGKLLKNKDDYEEDWEFSLDGQKRYFKAKSHKLERAESGTLISLYDMTYLTERDEIAAMKDNMQIGLFFMDKNYVIQDHYSRYLEEVLMTSRLQGRLFTDVIAASVSSSELETVKDFFNMLFESTFDREMLDDINPLSELHYINSENGERKVLQCAFATIERGRGEVFILATIYDITARVELQNKLAEEEARRLEEMQSVFEFLQVPPDVFSDFMSDMEYEFGLIEKTQKDETLSTHEALVKIYQSVHAIKSNAVILGLSAFGKKLHNLETRIKKFREKEGEIPFSDMLELAVDIEKIFYEKEGFGEIIGKLKAHTSGSDSLKNKQPVNVLMDTLEQTAKKCAEDHGKLINFVATDLDNEAFKKSPRGVVKEILMQFVRNSAVHGIEAPDVRAAKGKREAGTIKVSIRMAEDHRHVLVRFADDGSGLDFNKIKEKALSRNLLTPEEAENRDLLKKAIFLPGFSTSDTEGMHAGRGIGLNLVQDRLKEAKGSIKMRSEDGKGIVFLITVPVLERTVS